MGFREGNHEKGSFYEVESYIINIRYTQQKKGYEVKQAINDL